jgi:methylglyoxal synthase
VRACDVHDVVCATNLSSARHVLRALAAELDEAAQKR